MTTWKFTEYVAMPMKLAGGFNADLTSAQANEWHKFVQNNETWRLFCEADADCKILMARQHGTSEDLTYEIRGAKELLDKRSDEMFALASEWYAALCKENPNG